MPSDIDLQKRPKRNFRTVAPGDDITARGWNDITGAFNDLFNGVDSPTQGENVGDDPSTDSRSRLKIEIIAGDYLVCSPWNGQDQSNEVVSVARPEQLRTSLESRGDQTFTYNNDQERVADDGATTETQVIVPSYIVDDVIYAMRGFDFDTGAIDDNSVNIEWLDLNNDARAWAKKAE